MIPAKLSTAAAVLALIITMPAAAEVLQAPCCKLTFPSGWHVSRLPTPTLGSGKQLPGERIRAVLSSDGIPSAAAEFSWMPRYDGGSASLNTEFERALKTIEQQFRAGGFQMEILSRKQSSLGGHPAREAEIAVTGPKGNLRQWINMALSTDFIYSFSCSAEQLNYGAARPVCEQIKESGILK